MAKVSFEDLKLSEVIRYTELPVNTETLQVKSYLPIKQKIELIEMVIQESTDPLTNIVDKVKMDGIFNALIAIMYADIEMDSTKLLESYDVLEYNGVMDSIISIIPEDEYNTLVAYLDEAISDYDKFRTSVPGMISQFINGMPEAASQINSALETFDPGKFTQAISFAQAISGNENAFSNRVLGQK